MSENQVIVVWCDSPTYIYSTPANDGEPVKFYDHQLPSNIPIISETDEVFAILKARDATKVAIPVSRVTEILGWQIDGDRSTV
jgi:hypothetical protein